jgi:hypothetical protein
MPESDAELASSVRARVRAGGRPPPFARGDRHGARADAASAARLIVKLLR